ncbi:MAG: serine/threonine protein kinase [Muribaculaceae bacterium]|nr:serine/threonine protein kinase [Muribaculaceae bacterium]
MKQPLGNGVRVGAFYIVSMLSDHGGFSFTYLAEGPGGRRVVLKELFLSDLCERDGEGNVVVGEDKREEFEEVLRAFRGEGRRLKELGVKHRHIVNVYDLFDAKGTAYLVMEYISGKQLHEWTDGPGAPDLRRLRVAMTALCDALQYLHEKHSLFHFDLKSTNVMIEEGSERPVLIDFGTSRHYDSDSRQTIRKCMEGFSPGYMAPEFVNRHVDGSVLEDAVRIDVFGLGATLFRVLTRKNPPVATSDALVERMLGEAGLSSEYAPYIEAVKAAMRYEQGARLQSVAEFGRMLGFELEHSVEDDVVKTVRRAYEAEPKTEKAPRRDAGEDPERTDPEGTVRRPTGAGGGGLRKMSEALRVVVAKPVVNPAERPAVNPAGPRRPVARPDGGASSVRREHGGSKKWIVAVLLAAVVVLTGIALWLGFSSRPRAEQSSSSSINDLIHENYEAAGALQAKMDSLTADSLVHDMPIDAGEEPVDTQAPAEEPADDGESRSIYKFPNGGNYWYGPLYKGLPDGVGELCIFSQTTIGDSVLYEGWTVRNAVFEDGLFISGDVFDAEDQYRYTYIP